MCVKNKHTTHLHVLLYHNNEPQTYTVQCKQTAVIAALYTVIYMNGCDWSNNFMHQTKPGYAKETNSTENAVDCILTAVPY